MTQEASSLRSVTIYDTMSRSKKELIPIEPGKIKMYVCGVTVYDLTHIGHARTFVFFDVVQRFLRHLGYDVTHVRNHTDVDDKIIKRAAERGVEPLDLSEQFIKELERDFDSLHIQRPDVEPKVSTHIEEIIEMVKTLVEREYAYVTGDGDVFYRVNRFDDYGKLSKRRLEDMEAGRSGRVQSDDDLQKEHPFDFALWKSAKPGEPSWESPWGAGRPGWHIECSAMSMKHLGQTLDIHGGGQDLSFPHHENEIAQSEGCTGKTFANNWMHVAMLNIDGEKMSKSLGNFWTTRDVLEKYHPEVIRLFMYNTHYRNPLNYSFDALNEATRHMVYFYDVLARLEESLERGGFKPGDDAPTDEWMDKKRGEQIVSFMDRLEDVMASDFNTGMAVTLLHEQAKWANELTQSKKKPKAPAIHTMLAIYENIRNAGHILGVLQGEPSEKLLELRDLTVKTLGLDTAEIEAKIDARNEARANKEWSRADEIRDELLAMQVEIMDGTEGTSWRIHYAEKDH